MSQARRQARAAQAELVRNEIERLEGLRSMIVEWLSEWRAEDGITEGAVRVCSGSPSYRRLDCDRRALAYLRIRERLHAVRVDVSGLWRLVGIEADSVRSALGGLSLLVHDAAEARDAMRILVEIVVATRADEVARTKPRLEVLR